MMCVLILLPLSVWEPFRGTLYHESVLTLSLPPVSLSVHTSHPPPLFHISSWATRRASTKAQFHFTGESKDDDNEEQDDGAVHT